MGVVEVRVAQVSALVLGLMLAGCGSGGGGGVVSSPAPAPTPTASYTKIADMTGDRTFQTAGIRYNYDTIVYSNGSTQAFGNGITVAYIAATDSYRVTGPDGATVTFDPSNAQAPNPAAPNSQQWIKTNGSTRDVLTISVPTVGGVALSYTLTGSWGRSETSSGLSTNQIAVGGVPTIASDMPRTGTASYSTQVGGVVGLGFNRLFFALNGNSSATFSANFGSNSVATTLTLAGTPLPGTPGSNSSVTSFGTFNGTGTISSTGPGFTGTLTGPGDVNGVFSGAFFGPRAQEMGYDWFMNGPAAFSAVGTVVGVKQ